MYSELYNLWLSKAGDDIDLISELKSIKDSKKDIQDRFYKNLEFGTAGIRGIIGAGTNRINIYVVRKVTQAFAEYLMKTKKYPSIAISYDNRIKSELFAREAACVMAANGVKVHVYKELMPVPCLSFAVRNLKCDSGIMITASHNPAEYNGYKVYGSDGCQLREDAARAIHNISLKIDMFDGVNLINFNDGLSEGKINYISDEVKDQYMSCVESCLIHPEIFCESDFKVVYTPLNGAGNKPIREMFSRIGVDSVYVVKEQENPDGNFSTCKFPNPEVREALSLGLKYCEKYKPDILIATDPDCDRVGVAVPNEKGEYVLITGNELGALLLEYICGQRIALGTLPKNPVAVKTIVSSNITERIAAKYGVDLRNVLTGFKYIGEQIAILEKSGEENRFVFGFEESHGYLVGSYVRDKDGVVATMLICELTAFYKKQGKSVLQVLRDIYKNYGVYKNVTDSYVFDGMEGMGKMKKIMSNIRENMPKFIGNLKVVRYLDYLSSEEIEISSKKIEKINLPKSDVLEFKLEKNASVIVRPSGTEPKIKVYYTSTGENFDDAEECQKKMRLDFDKYIKK